jgi:curved DNA-binding protein CbpA
MIDHFASLDQARRPWLDLESLKAAFLALSAQAHPDRIHGGSSEERAAATDHYAELNAAYTCLREPKDRLAHLLELESGAPLKDVQRIPPGTMDLFMEVGQVCRDIDTFLAERAKTTSPLLKVRFFEKGMEWIDRLQNLQTRINVKREALLDELSRLDSAWMDAPPSNSPGRKAALPLARLEEISRIFSYISRWTGQLQDRALQLDKLPMVA